jgi:hypothetical protein
MSTHNSQIEYILLDYDVLLLFKLGSSAHLVDRVL